MEYAPLDSAPKYALPHESVTTDLVYPPLVRVTVAPVTAADSSSTFTRSMFGVLDAMNKDELSVIPGESVYGGAVQAEVTSYAASVRSYMSHSSSVLRRPVISVVVESEVL